MLRAVENSRFTRLFKKQTVNLTSWNNQVNADSQTLNQKLTTLQSSRDKEIVNKNQKITTKD